MEPVGNKECVECGVVLPSDPHLMIAHWKRYHYEPPKTDVNLKRHHDFIKFFNKKVKEDPQKYKLKDISVLTATDISKQGLYEKVSDLLKDVSNVSFTELLSGLSRDAETSPPKEIKTKTTESSLSQEGDNVPRREEIVVKQEKRKHRFTCNQCGATIRGIQNCYNHFQQHDKQKSQAAEKASEPDIQHSAKTSLSAVKLKTDGTRDAKSEKNLMTAESGGDDLKTAQSSDKGDSAELSKDKISYEKENRYIVLTSGGRMSSTTGKTASWNSSSCETDSSRSSVAPTSSRHLNEVASKSIPLTKLSVRLNNGKFQQGGKEASSNQKSVSVSTNLPTTSKPICRPKRHANLSETAKMPDKDSSKNNEKSSGNQSTTQTKGTKSVKHHPDTRPKTLIGTASKPVISSTSSPHTLDTVIKSVDRFVMKSTEDWKKLKQTQSQKNVNSKGPSPNLISSMGNSYTVSNSKNNPRPSSKQNPIPKSKPTSSRNESSTTPSSGFRLEVRVKNASKIGQKSGHSINGDDLNTEIADITKNGAQVPELSHKAGSASEILSTQNNDWSSIFAASLFDQFAVINKTKDGVECNTKSAATNASSADFQSKSEAGGFAFNVKGNEAVAKDLEKLLMHAPDTVTSKAPVWKSKLQRDKEAAEKRAQNLGDPNNEMTPSSDNLVPLPTMIPPPKSSRIRSSYSAAGIAKRVFANQTVTKQQYDQPKQHKMPQKLSSTSKSGKKPKNVRQRSKSQETLQESHEKDADPDKNTKKNRKSSLDDSRSDDQTLSRQRNFGYSDLESNWGLPDLHRDVERSSRRYVTNQTEVPPESRQRDMSCSSKWNNTNVDNTSSEYRWNHELDRGDNNTSLNSSSRHNDRYSRNRVNTDPIEVAYMAEQTDVPQKSNLGNNSPNHAPLNEDSDEENLTNSKNSPKSIENQPVISSYSNSLIDSDVITIDSDSDDDDEECLGYQRSQLKAMLRLQQKRSAADNHEEEIGNMSSSDDAAKAADAVETSNQTVHKNSSDESEIRIHSVKSLSDNSLPGSCHSNPSVKSARSSHKDISDQSDSDAVESSDSDEEIPLPSKKSKTIKRRKNPERKSRAAKKRKATAIHSDVDDPTFEPDMDIQDQKTRKKRKRCISKQSSQSSFRDNSSDASLAGVDPETPERGDRTRKILENDLELTSDDLMPFCSPAERVKINRRKSVSITSNESNKNEMVKRTRRRRTVRTRCLIESSSDTDDSLTNTPPEKTVSENSRSVWSHLTFNSTRDVANKLYSESDSDSDKSLSSSPLSQRDFGGRKSIHVRSPDSDGAHEERMFVEGVSESPDFSLTLDRDERNSGGESEQETENSTGAHGRKDLNSDSSNPHSLALTLSPCTASPDLIAAMESTPLTSQAVDAVAETSEEVLPKPPEQPRKRRTARKSIRKPPPQRSVRLMQCQFCDRSLPIEGLRNHMINDCEGIKNIEFRQPEQEK